MNYNQMARYATTDPRSVAADYLAHFPQIGTLVRGGGTVFYTFLPNGTDAPIYCEHTDIEEVAAFISFKRLTQVGPAK